MSPGRWRPGSGRRGKDREPPAAPRRAGVVPFPNGEKITDTDVVIWYLSSAHHEPRSEDGRFVQDKEGNYRWQGITLLMWTGFDLVPHNFMDGTPLYHPSAED
jgi:Cu2+-containing amine oxidase